MSGTTAAGIPAGFGGYAASPSGEMAYWNYQQNPFKFLLQPQDATRLLNPSSTTPAAAVPDVALANGGVVPGYDTGGAVAPSTLADQLRAYYASLQSPLGTQAPLTGA